MRKLGLALMILGAFLLFAAVAAVVGPSLQAHGINVVGFVTSVKGVSATGALLLVLGAALRRARTRQEERKG